MRKNFLLLFLFLTVFANNHLWAQKITVNAALDSSVIKIGDQAHLSFTVSQKPSQKVIMPIFSEIVVGGLELVEPVKLDTTKSQDGDIQITQNYVVTAYEDSLIYIPSFPFVENGDTVWSKSLSIKVVQPFKIDTASNTITDIKPVMEPKFNWKKIFLILLIALFILGLIFLGLVLYKKYFKKIPLLDIKSQELLLPAHIVALSYLDKIKQEKAWQQGRSKEYHTQLTEVIREYIERMYNINSMEMTSEEILDQFRFMRLEQKSVYLSLQQILRLADLVKFAKWDATPDEHELSLMNAYLFVNQTKIEEVKPLEELKAE